MTRSLQSTIFFFSAAAFVGCGQDTAPKSNGPGAGKVSQQENDVIADALKAAGIPNKPLAVFDDDKYWTVTIAQDNAGPNGEPPPGSGPIDSEQVQIDKATKKVTRNQIKRESGGRSTTPKGPSSAKDQGGS